MPNTVTTGTPEADTVGAGKALSGEFLFPDASRIGAPVVSMPICNFQRPVQSLIRPNLAPKGKHPV
jgi:hypothetical protein